MMHFRCRMVMAALLGGFTAGAALAQTVPVPGPGQGADDGSAGVLGDIPGFTRPEAPTAANQAAPMPTAPASGASGAGDNGSTATQAPPSKPVMVKSAPARASAKTSHPTFDVERVVFRVAPIRVTLPLDQERIVSLPGPFALHAPEGFDSLVQSQIIERTAYLKARSEFGTVRVVAEDLASGRQIPIDFVAVARTETPPLPTEVFLPSPQGTGAQDEQRNESDQNDAAALDMVALTRHAAQSLYAPRRLIPSVPGVRPVPVNPAPAEGLYRGWGVETVPIGAWRSGSLYVTAVRFTNTGNRPIDVDLQELRGRWLAATAQHTRLLASDPAWRTTTVYLVCDRPFDACR